MQSRTELNINQIKHGSNLPRGYFKKRKHLPAYARPPDIVRMAQKISFNIKCLDCVHARKIIFIVVLLMGLFAVNATTTIEQDLKVRSLERTTTTSPELFNGDGSK